MWLGLPVAAGILLILGIVRKEFVLLGAVAIFGTTNLALYFSPVQLVVMALVAMLYIPCISTVAILGKEFGWKAAATISLANIAAAVLDWRFSLQAVDTFPLVVLAYLDPNSSSMQKPIGGRSALAFFAVISMLKIACFK